MPSPEASRKNWGKAVESIKSKKHHKVEIAKEKLAKCRNAYVGDDEEMEEKINRMAEMGVASDIVNGKDQDDTPEESSESDEECDFTDIIAEKMAKMKIRRKKAEAKRKVSKKSVPEESESESEESEEEEPKQKSKKGNGKKSNISVNVYNQSEKPSKKEKNNDIDRVFLKF